MHNLRKCSEMKNQQSSTMSNLILRRTLRASLPLEIFITGILFLALTVMAWAGSDKRGVDFSNYDAPLYEQITNRIKEKVTARLGEGKNPRDRYFIIPFGYQNKGNTPEFSHSFMTVIRVFADGRQPRLTKGLKGRTYKDRKFEAFTISWLPHDFLQNPHLCVFEGFGARLIPSWNKCPISEGKSFDLPDTVKLAVNDKLAVGMWGPYEITKEGFDLGVGRMRLLNAGTIKYHADDRLYQKDLIAISCFHAMAGLYELFPKGGIFGTGFKIWGLDGTKQVLLEYTSKATVKGILLEPVDVKRDLYGFVSAPDRSGRGVYDPFKTASAYRK
jgi:hypothetical protein